MPESPRSGVQSWAEPISARDRIRAVAETLREPRSVNWISEQANAAWSTTNEELQALVDQGQLRRVEAGETTRYQPDYTRLLFEAIRTLIEENTREELRSELAAITEEIEEWQTTYDIEMWEDLEQSLADGGLTSDALRDRRDIITFWRENEEDRRLITHALALYADVEAAREQMTDYSSSRRRQRQSLEDRYRSTGRRTGEVPRGQAPRLHRLDRKSQNGACRRGRI